MSEKIRDNGGQFWPVLPIFFEIIEQSSRGKKVLLVGKRAYTNVRASTRQVERVLWYKGEPFRCWC